MPRRELKYLLLPCLSGLLGFASFTRNGSGLLAWVAWIPLIFFVVQSATVGRAFYGGLIAGGLQSCALLLWIPGVLVHYGGLPAWAAWMLYIPFLCLVAPCAGVACAVTRFCISRGGIRYLWILPPAWIALEYCQNYVPFGGFPWLLIGYTQTDNLLILQSADLAGVFGVSFLILWINTSLGWLCARRFAGFSAYAPLALGILGILASLLYGEMALRRWRSIETNFQSALLQFNLMPDGSGSGAGERALQMIDQLSGFAVDLLVLPEAPSDEDLENDAGYREALEKKARNYSFGIVVNSIGREIGGGETRFFNSAYFLDRYGSLTGRYDKIHLVPFGEYIPAQRILPFIETISRDVGGFSAGENYAIAVRDGHKLNAIICFEAAFPALVRRFVHEGSELIVNQTNDGWYGDSAAPYQHLTIARWRAVENRRFLLRAANSGISAVIAPTGELQSATSLFRQDICRGRFAFISQQSFYTRSGDFFALLCVIITCGCSLYWCGSGRITWPSRRRPVQLRKFCIDDGVPRSGADD